MSTVTKQSFLVLCCLIFSLLSCKSLKPTTTESTSESSTALPFTFNFAESEQLMPLLDQAQAEQKLIFIDFYADWCLPCKMMEKDVFRDKELGDFFNTHFINYKVDGEKGNGVNLVQIFNIKGYPTLLFLNEKGQVLERKEGAAYHTELKALARRALAKQ